MALRNAFEGVATETKQDATLTALGNLLTELQQKYEGGAVALDAPTLSALESVTATVVNLPADYPLPAAQVSTLTPQTDGLTDAQLRASAVPVTVSNPTETGLAKETTLAAAVARLDNILASLDDAGTDTVLSVLQAILTELGQKFEGGTVNVGNFPAVQDVQGSVAVDNLPSTYPLPTAQVQTDALTDTELRATPVPVDVVGAAQEDTLLDVKRAISDYEERYEFDAEGNPLYVGKALDGTLTSATGWTVYKFTFVGGLPSRKQVRSDVAWDDRGTVF